MRKTRYEFLISIAATLSMSFCLSAAVLAQTDARHDINIEPKPVAAALKELAAQTGLQVLVFSDDAGAKQAAAIRGNFTNEEALNKILHGTGLTYERIDANTVAVRTPAKPVATSNVAGAAGPSGLRLVRAESANSDSSASAPTSAKQSSQASDTSGESNKIQEIVVTAQRREERLVDAPLSIAVIGGQQLDTSNERGIAEALSRVPGVINALNGGNNRTGSSAGQIVVRGVSPLAGTGTTAFYLDSVPFGFVNNPQAPDASAYDLERVEVLRGPQGTLYGASALNGVVRVLTHEPNLDQFEFKARTSISGTENGAENYRGDAAVNVPIVEGKLAIRAVAGVQDFGGWLDNINKKDANDSQVNNYRMRIGAKPTERLSLGLLGWMSRTNGGAPWNAPYGGEMRPTSLDERSALDFDLYGFNAGYDFNGVSLKSSTSYIDFVQRARFDYTPFAAGFVNYLNFELKSKVFAQELALSSTGEGDWRWSLGAIYRDATDYNSTLRAAPSGAFAPGYLAPTVDGRSSESYAAFGELTHLLFDKRLELTAGLRQFHDKTGYDEISNRCVTGGVPSAATPCVGTPPVTGLVHSAAEFDHLTPRFVASWHPSPSSTLYASYGEGFRSGLSQTAAAGQLGFRPLDPDELTNYEIGYKAGAWDGRLNFETAVFYIDWKNIQQLLNVTLSTSPLIISGALANVGSASGLGFEAGVSAQVIDGLTLNGSFSWSGLEMDQTVFNGAALLYQKGGRLVTSPEYTVAASVDYEFPLGAGFDGRMSVSANYVPEQVAAVGTFNSLADEALSARASFTVNARARWSASLFVENLTNDDAIVHDPFAALTLVNGVPTPVWDINQQRPRTIGLQLEYRY